MKNITIFITLLLFAILSVNAQSSSIGKNDLKFGLGGAFLGSGDIRMPKFEAELTTRLNRHFSTSVSLNFGHGVSEGPLAEYPRQIATTAHIDPNIFFSPFGNQGIFNLKIGTGASFMYVNDVYMTSFSSGFGSEDRADYNFESRYSIGANMIVEPEIRMGRSLISVKAIIQPYLNGDISSGVTVKFGRML